MNQTVTYVNILLESLQRKKGYLEEILSLTKEQEKLAKAEKFDEDAFGEAVSKKDVLINNINEIDKGFAAVYDRVRVEVMENKELYADQLKCIQLSIKDCVDLGVEIEVLEGRNKAALEQVFSTGFKNIRQVKQSKQIANKYYKTMANGNISDSMLYDRKK